MTFIEQIAPYVQKFGPMYDIMVNSPVIAQAVLESANGTSELAVNCHNYFGLKYRAGRCPLALPTAYVKKGSEQRPDGTYDVSTMYWFQFPDLPSGVKSYYDFINVPNYFNLKGITDPRTYLETIKKDGYATSLKYVDSLMNVINKYGLTKYDNVQPQPVPTPVPVKKDFVYNGIDYSLVFDPTYYSNRYADLKQAFGTDPNKLFQHFVSFGMQELRQAKSSFNPVAYKNRYEDLRKAFGDNNPMYYQHYIQCGIKEGRIAL